MNRDGQGDAGTFAGWAIDLKIATKHFGALFDQFQAQVAFFSKGIWIKAFTIIVNRQLDKGVAQIQLDLDQISLVLLDSIAQ